MPHCNRNYPECETCINREYDPFECEDCEDGSNYEGEEEGEEMSYRAFIKFYKEKEAA